MTVLSGLFYLRALRTGKPGNIFWGSVFGGLGYAVRQPALLVPIAYACTAGLICLRRRQRPDWRRAAAFLAGLVLMLLLLAWLTRNRETGTAYAFEIQATSVADGLLRSLRLRDRDGVRGSLWRRWASHGSGSCSKPEGQPRGGLRLRRAVYRGLLRCSGIRACRMPFPGYCELP